MRSSHSIFPVINNAFYYFLLACLIIFAGTRQQFVGTDTEAYYRIFELIANDGSWFSVHRYEPLYVFINALVAKIGLTAKELILLTAIATLLPISIFFRKASPNSLLSLILYMSIFGYLMLFNGVRQSIAIAFFVWFVYFYFHKRYFLAIIFAFISVFFHYTALIAIVSFALFTFFSPFFIIVLYLLSLPFILSQSFSQFFFTAFFSVVFPFIPEKYSSYVLGIGHFPATGLKEIFGQVIFAFSFYFYFFNKNVKIQPFKFVFLCSMLSIVLLNFFYYVKYFDRLSLYFYIFNAVSIPLFILGIKGIYMRFAVSGVITLFALLLLSRSLINGSNGITPYASWLF